jgi:L-iditol 2-dehydrogenase
VSQMLAAVYHGPEDLRLEERPIPLIGDRELLLKVHAASICATDLRIFSGQHRKYGADTRRIPGHEVVGTIAEVGSGIHEFKAGQRVFIAPNIGCGRCPLCRRGVNNLCPDYDAFGITMDGGFAEYMRVTEAAVEQGNVIPLADSVDTAVAPLIEPFACVLHGQDRVSATKDDVVLIQGAGPIGLMHLLLARRNGAARVIVTDQFPDRLRKARELGADHVVNFTTEDVAKAVARASGGAGADVVLVATPAHKAMEEALSLAAPEGRINYFAGLAKDRPEIRFNANLVHYKELIVTGSTGCSTGDCRRAAEIVCSGAVDLSVLITGRYPLGEVQTAFQAARRGSSLKVVMELD